MNGGEVIMKTKKYIYLGLLFIFLNNITINFNFSFYGEELKIPKVLEKL